LTLLHAFAYERCRNRQAVVCIRTWSTIFGLFYYR